MTERPLKTSIPSIAQVRNVDNFAEQLQTLLDAPQGQERMGCFHGPTGYGKTSAVGASQITYDALVCEVPENATARYIVSSLCKSLGLRTTGAVIDMIDRVAECLLEPGQLRPVVFDDAQYLFTDRRKVGIARDLYNKCLHEVPVVLVGEEDLPQMLTHYDNIMGRVSCWLGAEPCQMDDARQLAALYAAGITIADDLLAEFVARSQGQYRLVNNNLLTARQIAKAAGKKTVDLALWGDRPIADGTPPTRRDPRALQPNVQMLPRVAKKRAAQ